jgi:hypothetical protein
MRQRIVLLVVTAVAALIITPGAALAHHHRHGHDARRHGVHARHARLLHLGSAVSQTTTAPDGSTRNPGSPQGTNTQTGQGTAGTVASFENGVLTIRLNDGSIVSGKVTEQTRISCLAAGASQSGDDDQGAGDDQPGQQSGEQGNPDGAQFQHDQQDAVISSEDSGDNEDNMQSCDTSALKAGAVVQEAELLIGGSGSIWRDVEIVQ